MEESWISAMILTIKLVTAPPMVMELFVQLNRIASKVAIVTFMWHLNQCTLLRLKHMQFIRTRLKPLQNLQGIATVPTPP
jgi:hypothetical protein